MASNNFTQVVAYRQLDRAFLVDTQLAKQLGIDTKPIELVQLVFPYFIYPLGVLVNTLKIAVWQTNKELKSKKNQISKLYLQLFSISNIIALTSYLFNFVEIDNTSLASYNRYTCKAVGFLTRLFTGFNSWLYLLMIYLVLNLFGVTLKSTRVESQAPLIIKSSKSTRLNSYIQRLLVVFVSLCLVYSFDLVLIEKIEFKTQKNNTSTTFQRCGIPDSNSRPILILVSYLVDFMAFFLLPVVFVIIKTCLTIKQVSEKRSRLINRKSSTDQNEHIHSCSRTSENFFSRTKCLTAARSIIFIVSILPLFVCLIVYVFYISYRSLDVLDNSLLNIDLAFTILCLNNLLSTAVLLFFFGLYANKVFRGVLVDLFFINQLPSFKSCCGSK